MDYFAINLIKFNNILPIAKSGYQRAAKRGLSQSRWPGVT